MVKTTKGHLNGSMEVIVDYSIHRIMDVGKRSDEVNQECCFYGYYYHCNGVDWNDDMQGLKAKMVKMNKEMV